MLPTGIVVRWLAGVSRCNVWFWSRLSDCRITGAFANSIVPVEVWMRPGRMFITCGVRGARISLVAVRSIGVVTAYT